MVSSGPGHTATAPSGLRYATMMPSGPGHRAMSHQDTEPWHTQGQDTLRGSFRSGTSGQDTLRTMTHCNDTLRTRSHCHGIMRTTTH